MRFLVFAVDGQRLLAVQNKSGAFVARTDISIDLDTLIERGDEALKAAHDEIIDKGKPIDLDNVRVLPPLARPGKIICVGLNYAEHSAETKMELPTYPTLFARFTSSLVGHGQPIVRPAISTELDFEGELVAIIGKSGKQISESEALNHVMGYSVFNDASIRDMQMKTTQWTVGKNFDSTGAFGPAIVTADELPAGADGLQIQTRLNDRVVQSASTSDLVFSVASLVSIISEAMTLLPGDMIVTGTPSGVGFARTPKLFMQPDDVCEVEIQGVGVLRNSVAQQARL